MPRSISIRHPSRDVAARSSVAVATEERAWHQLDLRHVVESQGFSRESLDIVFDEAQRMELVRPRTAEAKVGASAYSGCSKASSLS